MTIDLATLSNSELRARLTRRGTTDADVEWVLANREGPAAEAVAQFIEERLG